MGEVLSMGTLSLKVGHYNTPQQQAINTSPSDMWPSTIGGNLCLKRRRCFLSKWANIQWIIKIIKGPSRTEHRTYRDTPLTSHRWWEHSPTHPLHQESRLSSASSPDLGDLVEFPVRRKTGAANSFIPFTWTAHLSCTNSWFKRAETVAPTFLCA